MLLSPQNLIFHKILKNRVYQIAKNPKKSKSPIFFVVVINSKLVREHFGPKKMTPPWGPMSVIFAILSLFFDFRQKKFDPP